MKTTAKYILSLRRLAIEVFEPNSNHHAITKELLSDFNVTEIQINDLLNKYNNYNASDLENLSINCNLVIDVMDFTKFKQDVLMWRRTTNLFQQWAAELKTNTEQPTQFKSKQELEN